MKSFIVSILFVASASASATPVLTAVVHPGFEPHPQLRTVTVETNGKVVLTVKDFRSGKVTVKTVARLAASVVKDIRTSVNQIDLATPLKDEREGEPMCTDTPSVQVEGDHGGQSLILHRRSGCHEWNLEYSQGSDLVGLALFFLRQ